jgi:uncharacterized protein (DUF433 family)
VVRDPKHLVTSAGEARRNVLRYAEEVRLGPALQEIMSYARGWYACRRETAEWALAPSKYVGYAENDAATYARFHQERDGRLSERLLGQWFVEATPGSPIHDELMEVLRDLFARSGKTPNKRVHLYVLKSDLTIRAGREHKVVAGQSKEALLQRVTNDPDVLGGRPAIRGLRVGVSDVLDLLAAGASREEILADFPYLEADDISAALEYAARAIDHRVINAA